MKRRQFIAALGGAAVWPLAVRAQQNKVWRIGYLHSGYLDTPLDVALFEAFRQQLRDLGYIEGKNLVIDQRAAEAHAERLPVLANELVALHPDVLAAVATPAAAAVQRATSTIPIVLTSVSDPVGAGFVKSLAHPGGNITGLSFMGEDFTGKSVEVLHNVLPDAKKIAVLISSNPSHHRLYPLAITAAQIIGLSTIRIAAPTSADLEQAFQDIAKENCDAVLVIPDVIRPTIVTLAASARIPCVYGYKEFVELGGLASYGPNLKLIWRQSAQYVDKIFKGADPANLPVEQPTKFELVINLKTAKALGLEIPPQLLARADEVIE
jgi:putative tryptophan/tyrosine transport system substrate-binding protein